MNDRERELLRYVAKGDIKTAQKAARIVLNGITSQKDQRMKENLLQELDRSEQRFLTLPSNLRNILVVEDTRTFPEKKFLVRPEEAALVQEISDTRKVAQVLAERGVDVHPSLLLYGKSGTGKTMLARYIAKKLDLDFAYIRFSSIMDSLLGGTQKNISKIFNYIRENPCVLCFDEIDAVGTARGSSLDNGEMSRITIALMQELDKFPNGSVLIGTTNRYSHLDGALIRRFELRHEVLPMTLNDMQKVAKLFFRQAKINCEAWFDTWFQETFSEGFPAAAVTNACTRKAVAVVRDELFGLPVVSSSKETQEVIHEEASPSPDNGDSVEQSEAPKTPLLDEELASLSLDKETREAVDGLLKEFAKKIDFSDEPGMDSLLSLEKLNANLLRISREWANVDRNLRPTKSRSGYLITLYGETRYSYHESDEKITVPLYKTILQCPYTSSFDLSVVTAQIMHELQDSSKGSSILTQLGIDKVYEKSEFYEDMIKDHEWCQDPDDYNIALQPKFELRRDYWYVTLMLTRGIKAFPADLRRI